MVSMKRVLTRLVIGGVAAGVVATVGITALAAGIAKGPVSNPDAGLTDTQRDQAYKAATAKFEARYQAWLASIDPSSVPYDALPHSDMTAISEAPAQTLADAKAHATLIVVGRVRSIRPTAFDGTYVTMDIDRSLKGAASGTLLVHQGGGLRPTPDWKGMFIADAPNAPLLLPGHRFIVFLQGTSAEVQGFTGEYELVGGAVRPTKLNPFGDSVSGKSEAEFVAAIGQQA